MPVPPNCDEEDESVVETALQSTGTTVRNNTNTTPSYKRGEHIYCNDNEWMCTCILMYMILCYFYVLLMQER